MAFPKTGSMVRSIPTLKWVIVVATVIVLWSCGDDEAPAGPDPEGGCCEAGGSCEILTPEICVEQGKDYQGDGSICDPNPCPQPAGACCDPAEGCTVETEETCTKTERRFLGVGTSCEPDPCSALCIIGPVAEGVSSDPILPEASFHCACLTEILFLKNADNSYEAALSWTGSGTAGHYGTFAEPFELPTDRDGSPCLAILQFSDNGNHVETEIDLIFWADDDGQPGEVLGMLEGLPLGYIAEWPSLAQRTQEVYELQPIGIRGKFWAGLRAVVDPDKCSLMMLADVSGDPNQGQRRAMTRIAPGLGYPEGWQSLEVLLGQPAALGIGVVVGWCPVE